MMPLTMVNPGEENVIKKSVEKKRQDDFRKSWLCYRRSSYRNL